MMARMVERKSAMSNTQQVSYAPLAGHPIKGCTGGLTNPVFRLAGLLG
jgi:hypothetical protein